MPIVRTLECPDCSHQFRWFFMGEEDWPEYCPACGNTMTGEVQVIPGLFSLGTNKGKAVDLTYRQMEAASEVRAEMSGDPTQKMTDLNDNLRPGDVAGKRISNAVTQYAEGSGHEYFQQAQVQEAIAMSKMGRERSTGERALKAIQGGEMARAPTIPTVAGFKSGFAG